MDEDRIGQRFERLLFFSAPLTLAAVILWFISGASVQLRHRADQDCYTQAANLIEHQIPSLRSIWLRDMPPTSDPNWGVEYKEELRRYFHTMKYSKCERRLNSELQVLAMDDPLEMLPKLRIRADEFALEDFSWYGFRFADDRSIDFLGTKLKPKLENLSIGAVVPFGLTLLLWLVGLYNTRSREVLINENAVNYIDVFPHAINIYSQSNRTGQQKNSLARAIHVEPTLFCSIVRSVLSLSFIAPVVTIYLLSLNLLHQFLPAYLLFPLGLLTATAGIAVVVCEFRGEHSQKTLRH